MQIKCSQCRGNIKFYKVTCRVPSSGTQRRVIRWKSTHISGEHAQLRLPPAFRFVSCLAYSKTLKKEAAYSYETSVDVQRTIWRYIPEYRTLQILQRLSVVWITIVKCHFVNYKEKQFFTCCICLLAALQLLHWLMEDSLQSPKVLALLLEPLCASRFVFYLFKLQMGFYPVAVVLQ
jgi:hypothetical protein